MAKYTKRKLSFKAVDDHGGVYTLHLFVEMIDVGTRGDPGAEIEGMKSIQTSDGRMVNRLDKGKYELMGQILQSTDPSAP